MPDNVNHPKHYTSGKYEVIDFIEDKTFGYCLGNAIKYISRAGKKDPSKEVEDLRKAIWYINRRKKQVETVRDNKYSFHCDPYEAAGIGKIRPSDFAKDQKLTPALSEAIAQLCEVAAATSFSDTLDILNGAENHIEEHIKRVKERTTKNERT